MALTHWGFIYTSKGCDPERNTNELGSDTCKLVTVGIERPEQGVEVAKRMVADGVQLIELCGGFGPLWTARIIEAIGGAVPVGAVGYGPEAIDQMHALFS